MYHKVKMTTKINAQSSSHDSKFENQRKRNPSSDLRCRRKLQTSLNAVKNIKHSKDEIWNNEIEHNNNFTYPQCSTCPDRAPGRLQKLAVTVCSECSLYLCTTCTRGHRKNWNGHSISQLSSQVDSRKRLLRKTGNHSPVCHEGHKDIPKYFCETCQDVVCLECIQTQHKKHEFAYAKDAYRKHKVELEKHVQNARVEADRIVKQMDLGRLSGKYIRMY